MLAVLGGIAGLVVARWTLALIASLLPPDGAASLQFELQLDRSCSSRPRCRSGPGLLFGLFPALHSTRPDLVTAHQGPGRPAVRRAGGGAVPHDRW